MEKIDFFLISNQAGCSSLLRLVYESIHVQRHVPVIVYPNNPRSTLFAAWIHSIFPSSRILKIDQLNNSWPSGIAEMKKIILSSQLIYSKFLSLLSTFQPFHSVGHIYVVGDCAHLERYPAILALHDYFPSSCPEKVLFIKTDFIPRNILNMTSLESLFLDLFKRLWNISDLYKVSYSRWISAAFRGNFLDLPSYFNDVDNWNCLSSYLLKFDLDPLSMPSLEPSILFCVDELNNVSDDERLGIYTTLFCEFRHLFKRSLLILKFHPGKTDFLINKQKSLLVDLCRSNGIDHVISPSYIPAELILRRSPQIVYLLHLCSLVSRYAKKLGIPTFSYYEMHPLHLQSLPFNEQLNREVNG